MRQASIEDLVSKTLTAFERSNAVLFLGAGASMEGKGPSGKELTESLKSQYSDVDFDTDEFLDVCQSIVETPPHTLEDLRAFVRQSLTGLDVPNGHFRIARLPWTGIFTTNYDDVVERAFDHRDCPRSCEPIYLEDQRLVLPGPTTLPFYKLMGCVRRRANEPGDMVLTRGQYNRIAPHRNRALSVLYDVLKSGVLVFAGYGFGDRLAFDALDQLIEEHGADNIPWSYCIGPSLPGTDKGWYQLSSRKIIAVEGLFSEYAENLWKAARGGDFLPRSTASDSEIIQLHDSRCTLPASDLNTRSDAYVLLTESEVATRSGDKDAFFEGADVGWIAFEQRWDFQRKATQANGGNRELTEEVAKLCRERSSKLDSLFLLLGGAGTGKTTFLRRLAFDVYSRGHCPVLILNFGALRVDFGQIDSLLEYVQAALTRDLQSDRIIPTLLLIDDAAMQIRQWYKLVTYLRNRGHSLVTVVAERDGEWNYASTTFETEGIEANTFRLSEEFDADDRDRIVEHLKHLGYIRAAQSAARDIIEQRLKDSLFATFYTFVHPSRIPLDNIIDDQFSSLPELQRQAFSLVCLVCQHDLLMPFELLVRALGVDFEKFHKDVLTGPAAAVIYEHYGNDGQLYYRPHHRIVAERTVKRFLSDPAEQFEKYRTLFERVNLANAADWKVITRLVVDHIGPNARYSPFSTDQQRQLLDVLIRKGAGRGILHHRGLLEQKARQYELAEGFLRQALASTQRYDESYRFESDQNILTSLGTVYADWGVSLRREGVIAQSDRLLAESHRCFIEARQGRIGNAHAFHAHAIMLRNKARVDNELLGAEEISEALTVLEEAKESLPEEFLLPIRELEAELLVEFGDEEVAKAAANELAQRYGSSAGFAVWAATACAQIPRRQDAGFAEAVERAREICNEGLSVNQSDYRLLKTLAKCYRLEGPSKLKERYETLLRLKVSYPRYSPYVIYELGSAAFCIGKYREAKDHFDDLYTRSQVDEFRFKYSEFVQDDDGGRKRFHGTVHDIDQFRGSIACADFREPYFTIFFQPRYSVSSLSRGDRVEFAVQFNHRGPYARDVRRSKR